MVFGLGEGFWAGAVLLVKMEADEGKLLEGVGKRLAVSFASLSVVGGEEVCWVTGRKNPTLMREDKNKTKISAVVRWVIT